MKVGIRDISSKSYPLIIPDVCINHFGKFDLAVKMIESIYHCGGEIVKFQCHIPKYEMCEKESKKIIPINSINGESIFDIINSCSFSFDEEKELKNIVESYGMLFISTPFSKEAVDRLEEMNVKFYKVGSGEFNNLELIEYIAKKGKPIILSTGMNDIKQINETVKIVEKNNIDFILLSCTSMYPTPYNKVFLGAMEELQKVYGVDRVGISDHSVGNYIGYAASTLGAVIVERHYTNDKSVPGPDVAISMDPTELEELIIGSRAIYEARGGNKVILPEEYNTIKFAFASIVTIKGIKAGDKFTKENIWVKRPGTGILAKEYNNVLGKTCNKDLENDVLLKWDDIG